MAAIAVVVQAPLGRVFGFLSDPRNRPRWQSSLKAIEPGDLPEPRVGLSWVDVTRVGIRPLLEITRMEPFDLWQERGRWRGVEAVLTLRFASVPGGTRIVADIELTGRGIARPAAWVAARLAPMAVAADLRRAGVLLARD